MFPTTVDKVNEKSLETILKIFLKQEHVKVDAVSGLEGLTGLNDNLNSEVKKLRVQYTENNEKKTAHMVVKKPLDHWFISMFHKIAQPFCHEAIWYEYACHTIGLEELSPPCFFGSSPHMGSLKPALTEKMFGTSLGRMLRKADKGIIMMENVSDREQGQRYEMVDKNKILDPKVALTAIKGLATFHGTWRRFFDDENATELINKTDGSKVSKADLLLYLKSKNHGNHPYISFSDPKTLDFQLRFPRNFSPSFLAKRCPSTRD